MTFIFGKKKEHAAYGVILDISSGSIGISIVEVKQTDSYPQTLFAYRTPFRLTTTSSDSTRDEVRKVREALLSASLVLSSEGMQALRDHNPSAEIEKLLVTCSSPWAYTFARSARQEKHEEFKVTKHVLNDLIREAESEIFTEVQNQRSASNRNFTIVERATVDVHINDYLVERPYGLKGTSLALTHIAGLVPLEIAQTVEEMHEKVLPKSELQIHTSMLVHYCVLRDLFPKEHSVCIVRVTADATEFGIVENNLLIDNSFVPYGSHALVHETASSKNRPTSDVYTDVVECESANSSENAQTFEPFATEYIGAVKAHINLICESRLMPKQVLIVAPSEFTTIFKELLTKALTERSAEEHIITVVDGTVMPELAKEEHVNHDTALGIGARFFHKLHGCAEDDIEE